MIYARLRRKVLVVTYGTRHQHAQFDLTLMLAEADGSLCGAFQYNTALFRPETVPRAILLTRIKGRHQSALSKIHLEP